MGVNLGGEQRERGKQEPQCMDMNVWMGSKHLHRNSMFVQYMLIRKEGNYNDFDIWSQKTHVGVVQWPLKIVSPEDVRMVKMRNISGGVCRWEPAWRWVSHPLLIHHSLRTGKRCSVQSTPIWYLLSRPNCITEVWSPLLYKWRNWAEIWMSCGCDATSYVNFLLLWHSAPVQIKN